MVGFQVLPAPEPSVGSTLGGFAHVAPAFDVTRLPQTQMLPLSKRYRPPKMMASITDPAEGPDSASLASDYGKVPKLCADCTSFLLQLENHCAHLIQVREDLSSTGALALWVNKVNIKSFHASVQSGCTLCSWMWKCFDAVCRQQRLLQNTDILDIKHLSFAWQRLPVQDSERRGEGHCKFALRSLPTDPSKGMALPMPPHRIVIGRGGDELKALLKAVARIGPSTSSSATIELIRHWIRTCADKHSICRGQDRSDQDYLLPGRLLDIANADNIRVVQTNSILTAKGTPEYAALSHCWGNTNKPQLNSET